MILNNQELRQKSSVQREKQLQYKLFPNTKT